MKAYPKTMKSVVFTALRVVGLVWLFALAVIFFVQEKLIFVPTSLAADYKFSFRGAFEEHVFSSGKDKIHSLLFRPANPKGVVLYFHGNAGSNGDWGFVAETLALKTGWSVWVVDYPGYGKSEGRISSEKQLLTLAQDFWNFAKKTLGAEMPIAIYGRSIGTGIAIPLAAENPAARLVLETPFFNLLDFANLKYPLVPGFLLKYPFRSDLRIGKVGVPILMVHGTKDSLIPITEAHRLAQLNPKARLAVVLEGGHNNLGQFPAYWDAIEDFLK